MAISKLSPVHTMASPTTSLHLSYFALPGRAELTRLLFAYGNVDFRDTRYTFEEYGATKSTLNLPFGQLPTLQVDGATTYAQSLAIARYAAKRVGLYPEDPLVALEADSVVDTIAELYNATYPIIFGEKDKDAQTTKLDNLNNVVFPRTFERLEQRVQGPFFTGATVTFADVYLLDVVENHIGGFPDHLKLNLAAYPKLQAIVATLHASDKLKAYYATKSQ
ncbi:hypothetical protein H310_11765 [Aphanomyces invadans]|uniref:Glutathione S-transferase n=1 Tax=Aphanomyces invadans TaxID=157072 RepID=A0A024TMA0_9STRA|nr:hypothetical protein H310_11765 [Aphanomyces invadans]ETV94437.1 hypothetical protein H310_11765 [Aphanomyces invadans]|eukprot:XP_008876752.1 hypothetical protein H310_11765 [Aphanomyces invadans]